LNALGFAKKNNLLKFVSFVQTREFVTVGVAGEAVGIKSAEGITNGTNKRIA
jgi:hypothetical protein